MAGFFMNTGRPVPKVLANSFGAVANNVAGGTRSLLSTLFTAMRRFSDDPPNLCRVDRKRSMNLKLSYHFQCPRLFSSSQETELRRLLVLARTSQDRLV